MPFTFAHPAIVLPFKRIGRYSFDLTALIIGSMTPDFEYFLRMRMKSIYSHTLVGVFWFDIPLGILIFIVYQTFVKEPCIDNLPIYLNRRFSACSNTAKITPRRFVMILAALLIGIASHLLWDSFTHPTGYFVIVCPFLQKQISLAGHHIAIYKLAQHSSTLAGLMIITIVIGQLTPFYETRRYCTVIFWPVVLLVVISLLITRFLTGLPMHDYGNVIVNFISGVLIGLTIACLIARKTTLRS